MHSRDCRSRLHSERVSWSALTASRSANRNRHTVDHVSISRKQSEKCRKEFLIANISVGLSMKFILLTMPAGQRNRDWRKSLNFDDLAALIGDLDVQLSGPEEFRKKCPCGRHAFASTEARQAGACFVFEVSAS